MLPPPGLKPRLLRGHLLLVVDVAEEALELAEDLAPSCPGVRAETAMARAYRLARYVPSAA